jgi:hypothetical protein
LFAFRYCLVIMNVVNRNDNDLPERDDERLNFERLLRRLDNGGRDHVQFGRHDRGVLSDRGAQRLGQSLLRATARGRQFVTIHICPYYMSAYAHRYSALLDFFATGQYYVVALFFSPAWPAPPPGMMRDAMEHIFTAMLANRQPAAAELEIHGASLTMQTLQLALQYPRLNLFQCRMEESLLLQPQVVLPNDTTNCDDHLAASAASAAATVPNSPERGICLHFGSENDWFGILKAATSLKTNVTSLSLVVTDVSIGRVVDLSSLIAFVTAQPNGMDLILGFFPSIRMDGDAIVDYILADGLTQCPGVQGLVIHVDMSLLIHERFPELFLRLKELVSNSALTRFEVCPLGTGRVLMSREQEQQFAVITQRNTVIPVYLQTTYLLKPLRRPPPAVVNPNDPAIVVYAKDGEDRSKHQFVLSHALSQAAVHPVFFSHFYEFVRNHADQLFGQEGHHQSQQQQQPHIRRRRGALTATGFASTTA